MLEGFVEPISLIRVEEGETRLLPLMCATDYVSEISTNTQLFKIADIGYR
jgi:hypothetical protein